MHGGTVEEVFVKIEDMKNRRKKVTEEPLQSFGLAAYVICRDTEEGLRRMETHNGCERRCFRLCGLPRLY